MIISNGPIEINHRSMIIENDKNYYNATDPKYILFKNMQFNYFENVLSIERTLDAFSNLNPLTMSVEIDDTTIFNSFNQNSDIKVFNFYNIYSTDNMLIQKSTFEHSFINVELGSDSDLITTNTSKIDTDGDDVHFGIVDCLFRNYSTRKYVLMCQCDITLKRYVLYAE